MLLLKCRKYIGEYIDFLLIASKIWLKFGNYYTDFKEHLKIQLDLNHKLNTAIAKSYVVVENVKNI